MTRTYDTGLVLGRFQMLHNGHVRMIRAALDLCDRVVVYIGSADKHGTERNPFPYNVRRDMLELTFREEVVNDRLVVAPLSDLGAGDNPVWGKYVIDSFTKDFGKAPDLYITGCEKERPSWFTDEIAPNMDELRLSRHVNEISASQCREYLRKTDPKSWRASVPSQIHYLFDAYKMYVDDAKKEEK